MKSNINKVRALIITGFGINCEEEMAAAYKLAGASPEIIHINELFEEKCFLRDFEILNFPGGFSFGDDLGSGKVLANKIKYKKLRSGKSFLDELVLFLESGKFILGICNGFQVLVKLGLLPNIGGNLEQEVTLTRNDSGRFIDKWCTCEVTSRQTPFLEDIREIDLPVRHGEGKLIIRDNWVRDLILENELNCLSYKENFNGSELSCAGLTDLSGQVLGMMPHPEAFLSIYNHPEWPVLNTEVSQGEGLKIFKNIVRKVENGKGKN